MGVEGTGYKYHGVTMEAYAPQAVSPDLYRLQQQVEANLNTKFTIGTDLIICKSF
jgi:hypothetical protein